MCRIQAQKLIEDISSRLKLFVLAINWYISLTGLTSTGRGLMVRSDGILRSIQKQSVEVGSATYDMVCLHNAVMRARITHSEAKLTSLEVGQANTPVDVFWRCMHGFVHHWQRTCSVM